MSHKRKSQIQHSECKKYFCMIDQLADHTYSHKMNAPASLISKIEPLHHTSLQHSVNNNLQTNNNQIKSQNQSSVVVKPLSSHIYLDKEHNNEFKEEPKHLADHTYTYSCRLDASTSLTCTTGHCEESQEASLQNSNSNTNNNALENKYYSKYKNQLVGTPGTIEYEIEHQTN